MQSIKSIYWTRIMYMMLRKVLRVTEEKAKAQSPYGGRTQHSSLTFPGLCANNFHLHPMLVAHFLNFITYQRHPTSPNIKLEYHCCLLTCSPAGQWLSIKRNRCLSESPESFYRAPSSLCAHADTFMHKYPFLLGNIPCESFISFCFPPTPTSTP